MAAMAGNRKRGRNSFELASDEFKRVASKVEELNIPEALFSRKLRALNRMKTLGTAYGGANESQFKPRALALALALALTALCFYLSSEGLATKGLISLLLGWKVKGGVNEMEEEFCLLAVPGKMQNTFLPPFNCSRCFALSEVPRVADISPQLFTDRYAYSAVPVVVTDAMTNWTATETFSFDFFKRLYPSESPALNNYEASCQFFPYKSGFTSLRQVFEMSEERAMLKDGSHPWYVGWSNCDGLVANFLRKHYRRPYFLPLDSESTRMDWIFMGSPGYGAQMHIDNVGNPSWQAQIKGRKQWLLEPPPECYASCSPLSVVLEPGDIIVVDTNKWYHQTVIVGHDLSITIGSEYD